MGQVVKCGNCGDSWDTDEMPMVAWKSDAWCLKCMADLFPITAWNILITLSTRFGKATPAILTQAVQSKWNFDQVPKVV